MTPSAPSRLQADYSVIVVGAGGHARSVAGVLHDIGCTIAGVLADGGCLGEALPGIEWLGEISKAREICQRLPNAVWVMAIGDNFHRLRVLHEIQTACPDARFPAVVHPSAVIVGDSALEEGVVLMPGAVVMAGCRLGVCSLVNTQASLDHESTLAEGASLASGAVTGGRVSIGRRSFIGLGALVAQGICIGEDSVIGAGALVLKDLPARVLAYGAPAMVIRSRPVDEPYL